MLTVFLMKPRYINFWIIKTYCTIKMHHGIANTYRVRRLQRDNMFIMNTGPNTSLNSGNVEGKNFKF